MRLEKVRAIVRDAERAGDYDGPVILPEELIDGATMTVKEERENELEALFEAARASWREGSSVVDFEPEFVHLLCFIEEHPACLPAAEELFLEELAREDGCDELIGFCMHSLRMSAVKDEAARLIDPRNPRGWGPLSGIVASFDDSWGDAEMYGYYQARR